jgi:hypothetical protein
MSATGLAVAVLFLASGCGGPKECKTLSDCCGKLKKSDNDAIKEVCEEVDEIVKAKDKDACETTVEALVAALEVTDEDVPKECKGGGDDKKDKKKKGDDDEDDDGDKKKKDDDDDDDGDKKKDDDDDDDDKKKDDDDDDKDAKKDDDKGGGGGGGCEAYAKCVEAMAKAYEDADFPGAKDAAKALKDSAKAMEGMKGSAAEDGCNMGLDGIRKTADAYKSMPKFEFPSECK